jgi:hypothetical protein
MFGFISDGHVSDAIGGLINHDFVGVLLEPHFSSKGSCIRSRSEQKKW